MKLFRRVTPEEAERVVNAGFENHSGRYLTEQEWEGVWVSDAPLDCNEGVSNGATVLIEIELALPESDITDYEWVEEGKPYREWLLPAELINAHAKARVLSEEEGERSGFVIQLVPLS
jgi:hypothetical protein